MVGTRGTPHPLPRRDQQASERRRQLLHVASDLIEAGGVDAVTLPAVTERAGCARTLVYRYFPSREALLVAVLRDYFERLDARIPEAEQRAALAAFLTTGDVAKARALVTVFWDVQVAAGLGGAILRATPLLTPELRALVEDCRRRYERRVTEPLRDAGLTATESRVALDTMIASFVTLVLRWRAGEIAQDEAIGLHTRATVGLVRGLLERRAAGRGRARAGGARRGGRARTG